MHVNNIDGTVHYDILRSQRSQQNVVSSLILVKSVSETVTRAIHTKLNVDNLNVCNDKNNVHQSRLSDLSRLEKDYITRTKVSNDAQSNVQNIEEELHKCGPITEEDWI